MQCFLRVSYFKGFEVVFFMGYKRFLRLFIKGLVFILNFVCFGAGFFLYMNFRGRFRVYLVFYFQIFLIWRFIFKEGLLSGRYIYFFGNLGGFWFYLILFKIQIGIQMYQKYIEKFEDYLGKLFLYFGQFVQEIQNLMLFFGFC